MHFLCPPSRPCSPLLKENILKASLVHIIPNRSYNEVWAAHSDVAQSSGLLGCDSVLYFRRFEWKYCLHLQGSSCQKTSLTTQLKTWIIKFKNTWPSKPYATCKSKQSERVRLIDYNDLIKNNDRESGIIASELPITGFIKGVVTKRYSGL